MSKIIEVFIDADNKPAKLPSPEVIVQNCLNACASDKRGIALVDKSNGAACAWVKFGRSITMGEARTQHFVTQVLNDEAVVRAPYVYLAFQSRHFGFIVMEYIDGPICDDSDAKLVAAAVQSLITVVGPTAESGPVGGGRIGNRFFVDWESSITYRSVQQLESHVNGILRSTGRQERVSFGPEVEAYSLRLCPSDINRDNFMKDALGRIVAVDFGATSFLPVCFIKLALREGDDFARRVAKRVQLPESTQLNALLTAHYALVPFNTNNIGVPSDLKTRAK